MELRDRVVLLTGASRGLGPVIAAELAAAGAHLALVARSAAELEQTAAAVRASGRRAVAIVADLADAAGRQSAIDGAAQLGPLDVLVNNAGIESAGPFDGLDAAAVDATIRLNLDAPIHLARLLLPGMLERRRGHIVNVASLAGRKGTPYSAVYSGTKAGLAEWSSALRIELRGSGVSLSVVLPGYVTGAGVFARYGVKPPLLLGSCTPVQVARAVVRAIRRDKAEVIVNSLPVRPFLALYALAPGWFDWVLHATGIVRVQKRKLGL